MNNSLSNLIARLIPRRQQHPTAVALECSGAHVQALVHRARHVRLVEPAPRPPVTPVERLGVETLKREGAMLFDTLADQVARYLYRDALRNGAWAVDDIGLFGKQLFVLDAAHELEAGDGILWEIETQEKTTPRRR